MTALTAESSKSPFVSPPSFDGMNKAEISYSAYQRGLIANRTELAQLAPIAPLYEYKLNVWQTDGGVIGAVSPKIGMLVLWGMQGVPSTIMAITAWGITVCRDDQSATTVYPENLSTLWVTEDMVSPDSIKPIKKELIEWTFDCQGFNDDGLLCQHFVGRDTTNGNRFYRTINQHGIYTRPYKGELTLGDFVESELPPSLTLTDSPVAYVVVETSDFDPYPRPPVTLFEDGLEEAALTPEMEAEFYASQLGDKTNIRSEQMSEVVLHV